MVGTTREKTTTFPWIGGMVRGEGMAGTEVI